MFELLSLSTCDLSEMDTQLRIDTIVFASVVTGVILENISLADLLRVYSRLYGSVLSIEEIALTSIRNVIVDEAYRQFPQLPTKLEAEDNWEAALEKAVNEYGNAVTIMLGPNRTNQG